MWQGKTYIQGPGGFAYRRMYETHGIEVVDNLAKADFVTFTGGEDVDPSYYKEKPLQSTHFNTKRDVFDTSVWAEAKWNVKNNAMPCVGICRGGQLLNVLNGGALWQHVNNHTQLHRMTDVLSGEEILVTSTHHQQMRPLMDRATIVAECRQSTQKFADKGVMWSDRIQNPEQARDFEVVWYEDGKDLCYQPHPEMSGAPSCTKHFFQTLQRFDIITKRAA